MKPKYQTAKAFRRALEDRLKAISKKEGTDLQRLRRQIAFDRFLARLFASKHPSWVLKGGYAMELRSSSARATKDIDLAFCFKRGLDKKTFALNLLILEKLREEAAYELGDFFEFLVGEAILSLDGAPYGGARFPVRAEMDGRIFVKFHLDVGVGDHPIEPLETIRGRNWLDFAAIPQPEIAMIAKEQQFAEKWHACTLPRKGRTNSRVRDLIDLVLLIDTGELDTDRVKVALSKTFSRRDTHPTSTPFPPPPASWRARFSAMAKDCGISSDIDDAIVLLQEYWTRIQGSKKS